MDQMTPRRPDRDDDAERPEADDRGRDAPAEERRDARRAEANAPAHDILALSRQGEAAEEATARTEGGAEREGPRRPSRWIFAAVLLLLGLALAWGIYGHWRKDAAATDTQRKQADRVPSLRVVEARAEDAPIDLTLPGETQPFATANIYARATGYITDRRVDIGSRVKKGDLLVHISAPDLDQQLEQAVATLGQVEAAALQAQANVSQAEANLNLAKVNLQRAGPGGTGLRDAAEP